jgi:thiamine biosynthesis lipoprotein
VNKTPTTQYQATTLLFCQAIPGALLLLLASCSDISAPRDWHADGKTMGSSYSVQIADCPESLCSSKLAEQIDLRLRRMDNQYSHYSAASEVSQFNQHASREWFPASHELVEIVELARAVSQRSNGAFDITIAPAVNAWGFGPDQSTLPPDSESLIQSRADTNYLSLLTRRSPAGLRKLQPELEIDLSAIAKGYAIDQIAFMLEFAGARNFIVEIGGELRMAGVRADANPWRVGIESPDSKLNIEFIIQPGDNAVATSGDYRNYYVLDGVRVSHTIDPATSAPVNHTLTSVTVVDPLTANADAWATALMVMGPQRGFEFAEANGIAALFLTRGEDDNGPFITKAMQKFLVQT